tara:strand:- start:171 stop:1862 length:1692 start_codon:yes stop_codon:yes gene_type:complete
MKKRQELIKAYIDFFKSKQHKEIPNVSLIPENDPTVLFTTAGMHPLVPYLLGQKHPQGKRLVNNQKCIRTGDIEEVGDESHLTFFEMLGNWSLGDYWKQEAIEMTLEFLTKTLKIPKEKISVTCFKGDKNASKDTESAKIWEDLDIKKSKIEFLGKDNWWGPAGKTGPCGPSTEMFVDNVEIGNDVLMQYNKNEKGKYNQAKQKNIDFGGGVERTLMILNNKKSVYETSTFLPIIKKIEQLSKQKYGKDKETTKAIRIIADHIKASVMIINEKIIPSNTEQGYVLRRLIRRAIRYAKKLNINSIIEISDPIFEIYPDYKLDKKLIKQELEKEQKRFLETLEKGITIFNRLTKNKKLLSGKETFLLYQSYGFPFEITQDLAKEKNIKVNEKEFEKELQKHQTLSRTATEGKFKSGLADKGEETTKLHTTTHLLNQALRVVLKKPDLHQKGSNITAERLRFDFNFDRKLTDKEKQDVEDLVNKIIKQKLDVKKQEMTLEQAKKQGIKGVFESKYGNKIFVYSIGDFSKEICAGPHINNTSELGDFKIKKEESSSAGVRRIKAVLE